MLRSVLREELQRQEKLYGDGEVYVVSYSDVDKQHVTGLEINLVGLDADEDTIIDIT